MPSPHTLAQFWCNRELCSRQEFLHGLRHFPDLVSSLSLNHFDSLTYL